MDIPRSTGIDKVRHATMQADKFKKTLSILDNTAQEKRKQYKETQDPSIQVAIERIAAKRNEFVQSFANSKMMAVMDLADIPNSELFLASIDPSIYAQMPIEERQKIQFTASQLDKQQNENPVNFKSILSQKD